MPVQPGEVLGDARPTAVPNLVPAVVLTVIAQVDVWRPDLAVWGDDPVQGPALVNAVLLLLVTAPVAWRRAAPLAATCVTMAAVSAQAVVTREPPIGLLLVGPVLLLVYSLAAAGTRRQAWAGLAVTACATAVHDTLDPRIRTPADVGDASYWWLVIGTTWVVGRYVGSRRQARAAAEQARRLAVEREAREREAVTRERLRIAHELHDVVAHSVSVVALQAGAALELLDRSPERAREPLTEIERTARRTVQEMAALVGILRTTEADETSHAQPGLADLPELVERVSAAGLPVRLQIEGDPVAAPAGLELSAYRIVQEALTNALKHAGSATHAVVAVRHEPGQLRLMIQDDGAGTGRRREDAGTHGHGHGLVGMRERVALYGGDLQAGPAPGSGFRVEVRLPVATR